MRIQKDERDFGILSGLEGIKEDYGLKVVIDFSLIFGIRFNKILFD